MAGTPSTAARGVTYVGRTLFVNGRPVTAARVNLSPSVRYAPIGNTGNNDGEVYKYPAGGPAIATFTGNFATPLGVVAAEK